jgi:hypothetical protein
MRWLERYLTEGSPRLRQFAEVTADLARREVERRCESEPEAPDWELGSVCLA